MSPSAEKSPSAPLSIGPVVRRYARTLWYRSFVGSALRRVGLGNHQVRHDAAYWDRALAGPMAPYLGGTVTIAVRDSLVAGLINHFAPRATTVLDVGCAAGSLSRALTHSAVTHYLGVDISSYAVGAAQQQQVTQPAAFVARSEFHTADLCLFSPPPDVRPDIFVFNEVLYYLAPEEAVAQVTRYLRLGSPAACAVASMKHDPKSRLILDLLRRRLRWVDAVLFQEKLEECRYRVALNLERPAYMLALFQLGENDGRNDAEFA